MKRLGMNDSDILEVMGWKDITMLRRYTAAVAGELAQAAHQRYSPGDALNMAYRSESIGTHHPSHDQDLRRTG